MSENRPGSGGTEDNVRDELDDATTHGKGKDATREAVEEEEQAGGAGNPSGGTKDAVKDDFDEAQRRSR
jgi:hypothetical protein